MTLGQLRSLIAEACYMSHPAKNGGVDPPQLGNDEFVRGDDADGVYDTTVPEDDTDAGDNALIPIGKMAWKQPNPAY